MKSPWPRNVHHDEVDPSVSVEIIGGERGGIELVRTEGETKPAMGREGAVPVACKERDRAGPAIAQDVAIVEDRHIEPAIAVKVRVRHGLGSIPGVVGRILEQGRGGERFARVADVIVIRIGLIAVGDRRTIVTRIAHPVSIRVALVGVGNQRTIVRVATMTVAIDVVTRIQRTLVAGVTESVSVPVFL